MEERLSIESQYIVYYVRIHIFFYLVILDMKYIDFYTANYTPR